MPFPYTHLCHFGYLGDHYITGLELDEYLGEDSGAVWEPAELDPCSYYIPIKYLEIVKGEVQGCEEVEEEAPLSLGRRKPIIPVEDRDAILRYLERTAVKKPVHENNGFRPSEPSGGEIGRRAANKLSKDLRLSLFVRKKARAQGISDTLFIMTWNSYSELSAEVRVSETARALHLSRLAVEYYAEKLGLRPESATGESFSDCRRRRERKHRDKPSKPRAYTKSTERLWDFFCAQWKIVGSLAARNSLEKFQIPAKILAAYTDRIHCLVEGCGAVVGTISGEPGKRVVKPHSVGFAKIKNGCTRCSGSYTLASAHLAV